MQSSASPSSPVHAPSGVALPLIARAGLPTVPVETPSGWVVERGDDAASDADAGGLGVPVLYPDVPVSPTALKEGVRKFAGRHFLGRRFVPKYVSSNRGPISKLLTGTLTFLFLLPIRTLEEKYELNLPPYPGSAQVVELPQRDGQSSQNL